MATTEFGLLALRNDANLLEYWKLSSATAEVTTPGNDWTNVGTTPFNAGKFGNAADYGADNTTKWLKSSAAALNDLFGGSGAWSTTFWVKLQTEIGSGSWRFLDSQDSTNGVGFQVQYEYNAGTRRLNFDRVKLGVADQNFLYNITLGTTNWYHIAATYDGTTLRGYVDGVEVGNVAASGTGSSAVNLVVIGNNSSESTQYASALMDDMTIFNRKLTAAEVSTIYSGPTVTSGRFASNLGLIKAG